MNPLPSLRRLLGLEPDPEDATADDSDQVRPQTLASDLTADYPDRPLDYTPQSLIELDEMAATLDANTAEAGKRDADTVEAGKRDAETSEAGKRDADADGATRDETIRQFGAYLGETFVRTYDGEWTFDERAGWVVELPVSHDGTPLVLTIPSVLGDVVDGASSFARVHDEYVRELDVDAPQLAEDPSPSEPDDPRDEPSPPDVVAAFDRAAAELAADHDALDFTPGSLDALDAIAAADRNRDTTPFDPDTHDLAFDVGGHTDAVAGYFAAVVRQHHDAAYRGELAETLVVDGTTKRATLEPRAIAAAVAADETSFARLYDDLSDDLGLHQH